ncbi:MAG TPA: flagellin [Bryobacteraceae bacterium]|nr:flagellin [Bryobacteraceae bacterium]HPT25526.1 flagellin [Bryobacteraceae bacterium]
MAFSINTNITSMQAQDYLRVSGDFQSKTINRVTSGLRIVSSGDDAAGLAIANSFRSDQAVLSQGIRNVNDGLATLQTIDGGITNISKLIDRARTLATQSASGTFDGDRSVLNTEFQSVLTEIDRQAQAIGLDVGGSFAKELRVFIGGGRGASDAATITNGSAAVDLSASTVDTKSLGLSGYAASGATGLDNATTFSTAKGAATTMTYTVSGAGFSGSNAVGVTVNLTGVNDLAGLVDAINAGITSAAQGTTAAATAFRSAGISAQLNADGTSFQFVSTSSAFAVQDSGAAGAARSFLGTTAADQVKVAGGVNASTISWAGDVADGETQVVTLSTVDEGGTMHKVDISLGDTGSALSISEAVTALNSALQNTNDDYLKALVATVDGSTTDTISFAGLKDFNVTVAIPSDGTSTGLAGAGTTVSSAEVSGGTNVNIASETAAQTAVSALADAVTALGQAQAVVGKGQNTFNFAVSLASTQLTNLAASESRIRDADLAAEAANLTKAQILQQAGIAALAQANSAPQAVLSLLRS